MTRKSEENGRKEASGKLLTRRLRPRLTGRPQRQKKIGDDDILNLKIALETSGSLEDFLSQV